MQIPISNPEYKSPWFRSQDRPNKKQRQIREPIPHSADNVRPEYRVPQVPSDSSTMFLRLFDIAFILYLAASAVLLLYGLNCYVLLTLFVRRARETDGRQRLLEKLWNEAHPPGTIADLPKITTQLPLHNELNVAGRAIRAIAKFD